MPAHYTAVYADTQRRLNILLKVAQAVEYLHQDDPDEEGRPAVVHRDLKPACASDPNPPCVWRGGLLGGKGSAPACGAALAAGGGGTPLSPQQPPSPAPNKLVNLPP